jgi:hypothetical protein
MVSEETYHLIIGLAWLIVMVVAILFHVADGNVRRRRREDRCKDGDRDPQGPQER